MESIIARQKVGKRRSTDKPREAGRAFRRHQAPGTWTHPSEFRLRGPEKPRTASSPRPFRRGARLPTLAARLSLFASRLRADAGTRLRDFFAFGLRQTLRSLARRVSRLRAAPFRRKVVLASLAASALVAAIALGIGIASLV